MSSFTESTAEQAALDWLSDLGYQIVYGPDIAPGEPAAERSNYSQVVLEGRLRSALGRINRDIPSEELEEAIRKVLHTDTPNMLENNRRFHTILIEGLPVEYQSKEGSIVYDTVQLIDYENPELNDWLAVNQFTIIENKINRRPDIVLFVNGIPLVVIEMKNPADESATTKTAFNQLQTYKHELQTLFPYNFFLVISDGLEARLGTVTADWERFMPWRTMDGEMLASKSTPELEVLMKGVCSPRRFLDLLRYFVVYEVDGPSIIKKMAGYHQYHAVNKAIGCTLDASSPKGDRRVGVIWHTQGSGKSLTMAFYAGKIIQIPAMENPTIVMLTDRNDLDDQLFGTFSLAKDLLRQEPVQAESRTHLKELLKVAAGGVIFTTIQKFAPEHGESSHPLLSDRRNIIFIADEAHRSQYDFIDGFARNMRDALPNASFIGFTGTPIEKSDASTPAVFGDYIDIYDVERAVEDKATVPIYYEGRLAKILLKDDQKPKIDPDFEDVTEGEEEAVKEQLKSKWAKLEALVGSEERISLIAKDIVEHFEARQSAMEGKGMIVCMSRRICVELYDAIIKLRPSWGNTDDEKGVLKVVMTGSASDAPSWQQHIRSKQRRKDLADTFKDPRTTFKLAIVRDMWLTGFDVPCLHTMYFDKPMRGHGLMQAIARVNRVYKDKPGGLIVDYLGIAESLKHALSEYTEQDRQETAIPQEQAVAVMMEKFEIVSAMFHGFDYKKFIGGRAGDQLSVVKGATEHILGQEDGKTRLLQSVSDLSHAFALAVPNEHAIAIRDHVGFFQAVRAALAKSTIEGQKTEETLDTAVRQIISHAVASDEVIDIFSVAGLKKPDISILSDEFMAEVRALPQKNLAIEMLRRLLKEGVKVRQKQNVVEARKFSEMLEQTILKYQNRTIEAAQVIAELVAIADEMKQAMQRHEDLGLSIEEVAFYDALAEQKDAAAVMGDATLKLIAQDLVKVVRENATIDWSLKESARAKLRVMVKRLLKKYSYPPERQEEALHMVLEQAEAIAKEWTN